MENVMALAGLAGVMLLSLWLALGLVWLGLLAAFHLMPNSPRRLRAAAPPARSCRARVCPGLSKRGWVADPAAATSGLCVTHGSPLATSGQALRWRRTTSG